MGAMGVMILVPLSFLGVSMLFLVVKFFHRFWWIPVRIQFLMRNKGIKCLPYKFFHGNVKEIFTMKTEATKNHMDDRSHHIVPRIYPHIVSWVNIYGKNFVYWHGPQAQFVVTEPDFIKDILNNKGGAFPKSEPSFFLKKLLGDGLVMTSHEEKWFKLRKVANHAFHGESLKGMTPAMISSTEMMLKRWKEHVGEHIEVFEEFKLLTADVISRTAFGSSYLEGKNIFEMLSKLGLILSRNSHKIRIPVIRKFFKSSDEIESEKLANGIRDCIIKMVKTRETKVVSGELDSYGNDFLGQLVKSNKDDDKEKRITIDDLVDECKTFYIAGQETTNALLTWAVFLLATHTDWQEEARKEVLTIFGQDVPNSDGLGRLKTMNMIINESLRLYPPVAGIIRKVGKENGLGKNIFVDNVNVFIPTLALHHDPKIWGDDVHLFKPERFSEGVAKATNGNVAAFLPFGFGPRTCVGLNFAFVETKVALSMILQQYRFTISPSHIHSPYQVITICPRYGVKVVLCSARTTTC